MKSDLLPIGKMAELNHISIATLRLYDKMGLLRPRYTDPMTGYRYYDIQQNARLDMIAYMKELGMSLSEIGDVLQKEDVTLIEEILAQKNEQIHDQIRELRVRHDAVERAINCLERYRKSPSTGTISLEYIDQRYIWAIPCAEKLLRFCRDNHYIIAGDYVCEVLTEFNVFDSDRRSMFLRLQVPVSFLRNNGKTS